MIDSSKERVKKESNSLLRIYKIYSKKKLMTLIQFHLDWYINVNLPRYRQVMRQKKSFGMIVNWKLNVVKLLL